VGVVAGLPKSSDASVSVEGLETRTPSEGRESLLTVDRWLTRCRLYAQMGTLFASLPAVEV
jgi:hypothetical protein